MTALRALLVWLLLVVLASANGALRQGELIPLLGDDGGRALSSLLLCVVIAVVAWRTIRWIAPRTTAGAWGVGALWLVMTLAFEFLAGHYLFGNPWEQLLADYDLSAGRIWILVLVTTLLAPVVAARSLLPDRSAAALVAGVRRQ